MNALIRRMTTEIQKRLGENPASGCLYGSVTLGDFRPGWSDIDILFLTEKSFDPTAAQELLTLRQALAPENPLYRCFEGSILPAEAFFTQTETVAVYWGTSGQRLRDRYDLDVFSRLCVVRYGQPLCGDDLRARIAIPTREELRRGIQQHLQCIRQAARETDGSLYSCGWLLDIARCLYTLRYDDIIAKTQAGQWALDEGLCPDPDVMRRTLAIRKAPDTYKDDPDTRRWLCSLGPVVQRMADVLEADLRG